MIHQKYPESTIVSNVHRKKGSMFNLKTFTRSLKMLLCDVCDIPYACRPHPAYLVYQPQRGRGKRSGPSGVYSLVWHTSVWFVEVELGV